MGRSDPDLDLYRDAVAAYLDALGPLRATGDRPLSYDLTETVGEVNWHLAFIDTLIAGDVREALNSIHQWQSQLLSLQAWVTVLASGRFDDNANWTIRSHWVEPVATWCLLQPASTRDRLGNIATHVVHHGRLATDPSYKDRLEGDKGNRYLNRPQRERQLAAIGSVWSTLHPFLHHLASVDDATFRRLTFDFRNQASHSIAPRLEEGFTQMVKRRIEPFQNMVKQPDGTFLLVADPAQKVVSYGFGGTPPLPLSDATVLVGSEYQKARTAVEAYLTLVTEIVAAQREFLTPDA